MPRTRSRTPRRSSRGKLAIISDEQEEELRKQQADAAAAELKEMAKRSPSRSRGRAKSLAKSRDKPEKKQESVVDTKKGGLEMAANLVESPVLFVFVICIIAILVTRFVLQPHVPEQWQWVLLAVFAISGYFWGLDKRADHAT